MKSAIDVTANVQIMRACAVITSPLVVTHFLNEEKER
jgi:hypothetical protein